MTTELRLTPGGTLADLACGQAGYGLTIAKSTGARLIGVDVSAHALSAARAQAARLGVPHAGFRAGNLTATGLPGRCAEACCAPIPFSSPTSLRRRTRRSAVCWPSPPPPEPGGNPLSLAATS